MDRAEIQSRLRVLYGDELQYAIAREERFELDPLKEKATMRFAREVGESEVYELVRAALESVARNVERQFIADLRDGQLRLDGAIRIGNSTFCSMQNAREADWIAWDQMREQKFVEHADKRATERTYLHEVILPRLRAHGGNPRTIEAGADLFVGSEAA